VQRALETPRKDPPDPGAPPAAPRAAHGHNRELYIDAFRGLMALVMVQGHVGDHLLSPEARANALYAFQTMFHGSTAPGFLFASGFVAGLPRAPLSLKASVRRARRLLFVLGVGYALHLPYFSLWKTVGVATESSLQTLFACDALQAIAVSQLAVLVVQWMAGARWPVATGLLAVALLTAGPAVWDARASERLPPALGAYLDVRTGSHFPLFPFAVFVLAGTVTGAAIGRQEPGRRRRRALRGGLGLIVLAAAVRLSGLEGGTDFWGVSPAYTLVRLGGLLLLLLLVDAIGVHEPPGFRALALLGRETLLVFVLHLQLLYGGVLTSGPLARFAGQLGFGGAFAALVGMLPVLFASAWGWHRVKARAPHAATLLLVFLGTAFAFEFLTRPW
jgi:acyltransferase